MDSVDIQDSEVVENLQSASFAVARIDAGLNRTVYARSVTDMSRTPFRVAALHAGLTCRFLETADALVNVFKARQFSAAICLARSALSTAASLWQLYTKVDAAITRDDLSPLDDYLRRVFTGDAQPNAAGSFEPPSLSGFIRHAGADMPNFQRHCTEFLKTDQADWNGTGRLFADTESAGCAVTFKHRLLREEAPVALMANVFNVTSLAFEHFSRDLTRLMPRLSEIDSRAVVDLDSTAKLRAIKWNERDLRLV